MNSHQGQLFLARVARLLPKVLCENLKMKLHRFCGQGLGLLEASFSLNKEDLGEGNGNPLQCSCLENPGDGGAWWAAVYGVTQSDMTEAT